MKILFIGNEGIHTLRWISQLQSHSIQKFYFPWSVDQHYGKNQKRFVNLKISIKDTTICPPTLSTSQFDNLIKTIKTVKPDIVHSLMINGPGYTTAKVKEALGSDFPKWIVSNWGTDIHFYGHDKEHARQIKNTLKNCDYYMAECQRDIKLARDFGFSGTVLGIQPVGGGFDLEKCQKLNSKIKTSKRKWILIKGYDDNYGRALSAIKAIEMCAPYLIKNKFRIGVYGAYAEPSSIKTEVELLRNRTGVNIKILPPVSHNAQLKRQGNARIAIGDCASDGISTSLLDAMVMGAFPIQSNTACTKGWIKDKQTGLLMAPNDPKIIYKALKKALENDLLVDSAAKKNFTTISLKAEKKKLAKKIENLYLKAK